MRYEELSEIRRRQLRYGALGVAIVLLAAGLFAFTHRGQRSDTGRHTSTPESSTAALTAPSTFADDVAQPNVLQRDQAVDLVGEARRQAAAGNFSEAEASLGKAERSAPQLPEIAEARREIARLKTPEGSFAVQLQRAHLAIEHDDNAAAEAALGEANRIKPNASEVAELRAALEAAREKAARRGQRIAEALGRMREAVVRRDFAAADSALNEAERIDAQNPSIRRARGELARARGAQQTNSQ